ncbi:MAG: AbrB/MazE/SpoVT family DNA-binding domain-containing protein [Thermosphaera sp.]|nr:AbrB/MazE/SpoVT family DNA-binding domain-containing protein [Thermosphaera sp.]
MKRYTRRVQFTGKSTYIVSLPKTWVVRHGLKPGSQVVVEERGGIVVVKPMDSSIPRSRSLAISIDKKTNIDSAIRMVIAAYIMGYDVIVLKTSDYVNPLIRNTIRELIVKKLPGVEIIGEDEKEIRLQVLLNTTSIPIQDILKRLVKVVYSVVQDACMTLTGSGEVSADEVVKEDDSVDRVYFYAIRALNMAGEGDIETSQVYDVKELLTYRSLSKLLERIGDHGVNIVRNAAIIQSHRSLVEEVGELCNSALNIYLKATNAFFEFDYNSTNEIDQEIRELREKERALLGKYINILNPKELIPLLSVLESARRISEYSRDIAELAIDINIYRTMTGISETSTLAENNPPS